MYRSAAEHRTGRLTAVEVVVIVAVGGTLASLLVPDSATKTRREIEKRIETWQPGPDDRRMPPGSMLRPNGDITGKWHVKQGRGGTSLTVWRNGEGEYLVQFHTGGCLGVYSATRLATFRDGVLLLSEPVSEYPGRSYDRLYAIEHEGNLCLLPAASLGEYEAGSSRAAVFRRDKTVEAEST